MSKLAETLRMNESELVGLAKNGCNEAFAELVRLHQSDLRGFLVRRTGNLAIADDLAQEVFLAAIKQIGSLGDDRRFRSWLFTVARNKLVDHLRSLSREKTSNQIEQLIAQENVDRTEQETLPIPRRI